MSNTNLEIELRYKIQDVTACLDKLGSHGVKLKHTQHLIDEWYIPDAIHSREEHDMWFDGNHGLAWRIRKDEGSGVNVTGKQLTNDNDHNSFQEFTLDFDSYEAATTDMLSRHYYNWLTIDKTRYTFDLSGSALAKSPCELILDHVAGLADKIGVDACLEIEYQGTGSRPEALQEIGRIADMLGLTDANRFEKSLTVEAMSALARFK